MRLSIVLIATALVLASCGGSPEPIALRLVDLFEAATVQGTVAIDPVDPTEWRFDGEGTIALPEPPEEDDEHDDDTADDQEDGEPAADLQPTFGWAALSDVEGLEVVDGRLVGTTGEFPVLHAVRPDDLLDENDLLHAVEITMQVSAGTAVGVTVNGGRQLNEERVLRSIRNALEPPLSAELEPGDEFHTYRLENPGRSFSVGGLRNILVQPTDEAGAVFAIESVRLIMRREHLRSIGSGPGWQGLDEIYRETIVSRAPERLTLDLDLPAHPWLELAVGTVEDHPVTFNVAIDSGSGDTALWRRTVTLPRRWETQRIDLAAYAGQQVTIALSLEGDEDGLVGFWGTPVVRNSGARVPPVDDARSEARAALADGGSTTPQGVIVFLGDTLRRDRLDAWGHGRKTAPTLTALAAEGVRFADAISPATWTKVAVPSLLSSVYPASHGIVGMADRLSSSATTMAEAFRGAGYATFATSSVSFTGKLSNVHQGVEVLHERASIDNGSLGHSSAKTARTYVDRFLPTLLELSGIPVPETAQGQSLMPMVVSPNDPTALGWIERPAFSERQRIASRRERADYDVDQYSVVSDGWKLVRNVDSPEGMPEFELYNHADDPLNHTEVAAGHPDIVERLTKELAGRLRYAEARKLPTDEDAADGLSPEELQRLRSLGYIR